MTMYECMFAISPFAAGDDDKARLTLTALFINMLFYEAGRGTCCGC